jgi:hypothetical protein
MYSESGKQWERERAETGKAETNGQTSDSGEPEEQQHWQPGGDNPTGWDAMTGDVFILDAPKDVPALWGKGQQVLWAEGESLMIGSQPGLGKTTLAGQLILGQLGISDGMVLDLPVREIDGQILYLAMDRPPQISRSMQRQFTEGDRDVLRERLIVRKGPPVADLAKDTTLLARMADYYQAAVIYVDSVKDAAIKLSDDEVGAAYNRARQQLTANGVQLGELHHTRKLSSAADSKQLLADIYGSTWLTAGAGSVILLTGEPGDLVVGFRHVKPVMEVLGPFDLSVDPDGGLFSINPDTAVDVVELVTRWGTTGLTAAQLACVMFRTDNPSRAETARAARRLMKLTTDGQLTHMPGTKGGAKGEGAASWFVA